jgi:DNA-binding transcriptional LysR family regulator
MDTRFLESFVAVVETGSFAEAGRRLNLTPAAVAQRVRTLEAEIGSVLLARSGRTVHATDAGMTIAGRLPGLLRELRDLGAVAAGEAPAGELRLGAIATALTSLVPAMLKPLTTDFPQIGIYVMPGTSNELYEKVLDGGLDAAVIVQPAFNLPKTCLWQGLRSEPLVLIAPRKLSSKDVRTILATEPFIRYDRNHWGGRLADAWLRSQRLRLRERFELDALDAIAVMVDRGLGVSVVPDWSPPWPAGLALDKRALDAKAHARRVGVIWRRDSPRQRLVDLFVGQAPLFAH